MLCANEGAYFPLNHLNGQAEGKLGIFNEKLAN